jgi:thioredoxin 1
MDSFKAIIKGETPVLVGFYTTWYAPCTETLDVLEEVKMHFGETLRILKVDADQNSNATTKYKILNVPSFLLFENGQLIWRTNTALTKDELIEQLNLTRSGKN